MPTPDSSAPPDSDASEVSSADASTLTEQTPTAFKSDAPTPDELTPAVLTPDQPLQESPVADAVADADITLHRPAPQESTDPSPAPEVDASPLSEDSAEVTDVPPDVAAAAMPLPRETENVVAAAVATAAVPEADIVPSTPVEATEPVGESDTSGATQASRLVEAAESDKLAADDTVVEPIATSAANTLAEARPAAAPAAVAAPLSAVEVMKKAAASVLAPAVRDEYNRTNLDYRRPMPRPKVHGLVIDGHCHLLARRHADAWFEAADHYGFFGFITQTPLEEAAALHRDWGHRLRFVAVPQWGDTSPAWADNWRRRIDAFYNLGARLAKFHASPGNMLMRGHRLDEPVFEPLLNEVRDRGMCIMTHIGDPDTWYAARYTDTARFGTRDDHYAMWERLLERYRGTPWLGAHLGGNPEDLPRLQRLLDRFPDLVLDCSATRWMVREISARREPAREFFIRNQDRILFGSDQVSGDDRGFDFLASRIWCHRKLWETAYTGESPIIDPDVPADQQPVLRGLALPDSVLQKLYHDNAQRLLGRVDAAFAE
jgi:predicted TIM-barrel fold metal-dependent hydrolase